jgi:hypothetical protein
MHNGWTGPAATLQNVYHESGRERTGLGHAVGSLIVEVGSQLTCN